MKRLKLIILLCGGVCLVFVACGVLYAQSPFGWRGAHRDGIYEETGLLKVWPADGPELLWSALDAGKGHTSPVIVGDRLYITGMNEDETREIFSAYTLTGKKVYEVEYSPVWGGSYPETRTTPMIVGKKAFMISGSGEVVCLDITDGKIVWKVSGKSFRHQPGMWGTSECPLVIDGKKVIYTPSGNETTIVALDAETGKTIWKSRSTRLIPKNIRFGITPITKPAISAQRFRQVRFVHPRQALCKQLSILLKKSIFISAAKEIPMSFKQRRNGLQPTSHRRVQYNRENSRNEN